MRREGLEDLIHDVLDAYRWEAIAAAAGHTAVAGSVSRRIVGVRGCNGSGSACSSVRAAGKEAPQEVLLLGDGLVDPRQQRANVADWVPRQSVKRLVTVAAAREQIIKAPNRSRFSGATGLVDHSHELRRTVVRHSDALDKKVRQDGGIGGEHFAAAGAEPRGEALRGADLQHVHMLNDLNNGLLVLREKQLAARAVD